jgi:hypothetical protein
MIFYVVAIIFNMAAYFCCCSLMRNIILLYSLLLVMPEGDASFVVLHIRSLRELEWESGKSGESACRGTIALYDSAAGPGGALNLIWCKKG